MEIKKLQEIIENRNRRLEENTCATAEELITNITKAQAGIIEAQQAIVDWQKQLKELIVPVLNPKAVLGE